jgi:hypothetical protein
MTGGVIAIVAGHLLLGADPLRDRFALDTEDSQNSVPVQAQGNHQSRYAAQDDLQNHTSGARIKVRVGTACVEQEQPRRDG